MWGSQGCFANGIGEQEEAQAALLLLVNQEEIDPSRIGIMGYSLGGMVALAVGNINDVVRAIAAVSPVIPANVLKECTKPKLIVTGAEDNIIPPSSVLKETAGMAEPKIVELIPGVDHFWWGYEAKVGEMVADFFTRVLANSR
ncbi:prolyl oligopeptidase family serine peptidase [Desulfofundulus thermobenzoicus]|uniref:Prolyl oligopeptidase family serine peptidase n=1 Tax=Desulfofundulus thermobenzoicus TaxID=29376 RepID=A0A6N7IM42_9FIRM|nr:prolyl oligopeptidase family serine peptidase [Desulfofundulus thermobenzoicus]